MTAQTEGSLPVQPAQARSTTDLLAYLLAGLFFGVVLVKSGAADWYRMQEMFRFESFHMYGLMGSAVLTGLVTTALLRRFGHTRQGEEVRVAPKAPGWRRYVFGGLMFGVGWGLTGLCPGPILVLLGAGVPSMLIVLTFALLGTYLYGLLKGHLPH